MSSNNFVGSVSLSFIFMKRHNPVIITTTSMVKSLPEDWQVKEELSRKHLTRKMDEIPVKFEMLRTVNMNGVN